MSIINFHAPIKTKRIRGTSIGSMAKFFNLCGTQNRAHRIAKRSGSQIHWDSYKKMRNTITNKIRTKKSEYFTSAIEENKGNSPMLWKKLKEVLPKKQKSIPNSIISLHGENIDNPTDIADTLNEYFSTIGTRMAANDPPCEPAR